MAPEVLSSDDIQLLTGLGFLAAGAGLVMQAAQIFESLAQLRPTRAFPYVGMAVLHLNRQQPDQAVTALERGQRLMESVKDPRGTALEEERGILWAWKGVALQMAGRESESVRALQQSQSCVVQGATADMVARMLGQRDEEVKT